MLGGGDGECTRRFEDRAGVLKHVLDRGAGGIGIHQHDFIHDLAAEPESFLADLFDRHPVGKQADMFERDPPPGLQRLIHRIGIDRLHADDLDVRAQLLDVSADTGDQPAATNGDEDGVDGTGVLAQYLHTDGALTGDHIGVVIGVDEGHPRLLFQFQCMSVGVRIRITVQHHFCAAHFHRVHFDLRCGRGHHDGGFAAELLCGKRHALRMVASRGGDHPLL